MAARALAVEAESQRLGTNHRLVSPDFSCRTILSPAQNRNIRPRCPGDEPNKASDRAGGGGFLFGLHGVRATRLAAFLFLRNIARAF